MTAQPGRPRKFDDSVLDRVFELIASGRTLAEVAREVGVSARTVHRRAESDPAVAARLRAAYAAGAGSHDVQGEQATNACQPTADGDAGWALATLRDELLAHWAAEPKGPTAGGGQKSAPRW